jgi:hypothetical protein
LEEFGLFGQLGQDLQHITGHRKANISIRYCAMGGWRIMPTTLNSSLSHAAPLKPPDLVRVDLRELAGLDVSATCRPPRPLIDARFG